MIEVIAIITRINLTSVVINQFHYNDFMNKKYPYDAYRTVEENYGFFLDGRYITIRFKPEIIDELIEFSKKICLLKIENGKVISIKPFKSSSEEIIDDFEAKWGIDDDESIDIILTGKPTKIRDIVRVAFQFISKMEKEMGMVPKQEFLAEIQKEYEIDNKLAKRIMGQLLRDGRIYHCKPGYLKIT